MDREPLPAEDDLTEEEVQEMITPDTNRLDVQWARQPKNYRRVSKLRAAAKLRVSRAKNARKVAEAQTSLRVRENPDRYGFKGKLTEGVVESLTLTSKRVQAAVEEENDAQYHLDLVEGLLDSLTHMKAALENEVRLEARDYFARVPSDKKAAEAMRKSAAKLPPPRKR